MLHLFIEKDFESKGRKTKKNKKKKGKYKNYYICGKYDLKMEYIVAV